MKYLIVTIFLFKVCFLPIKAQALGLYLTAKDFLSGKMVHSENSKIYLREFWKEAPVKIKEHDSTFTYPKKDIYGYCDKQGHVYRFFSGEIYPLLNPKEKIILYKKTVGTGLRNSPIIESYFFSKDAYSEILPLSLRNIERTFSDNPEFEKIIEIYFRTDPELAEYDHIHTKYKLNRLAELSQ